MKNFIIFCCFIAIASAQWDWPRPPPRQEVVVERLPNGRTRCRLACNRPLNDCPIVDCPLPDRPVLNPQCPVVSCNAQTLPFLFPTPDPNFFYQCRRTGDATFETLVMPCGCMTQFDYDLQRCVHPHEFRRQCNATPNPVPLPLACRIECPGCDGGSPPVNVPNPNPTNPPVNNPVTNPPVNNPPSGCPCMPCVWWPCSPCNC